MREYIHSLLIHARGKPVINDRNLSSRRGIIGCMYARRVNTQLLNRTVLSNNFENYIERTFFKKSSSKINYYYFHLYSPRRWKINIF